MYISNNKLQRAAKLLLALAAATFTSQLSSKTNYEHFEPKIDY
jgi:hypothetical protein